ncbi:tellurite resistance TerB C-terminal domain-containing protein [Flavobacterium sp. WC2429]|uniref:Tellurite resistance TerB C-terminal domain-containing protein n=2 Tax=unclassified Flavobacterium TaxID=196869 RepID=A0AB39W681_9FLAO
MIGFIIISILVIIIIFGTKQDKTISNNYEKKHDGFLENFSTTANKNNDNSIIDITGQSFTINSDPVLNNYILGVPQWTHQYVYSYSEINSASNAQIKFYSILKNSFLKGVHYDLVGNTNYAFILLFDFLEEYDSHKNISLLESHLTILGKCYPKTRPYCKSFINKKLNNNTLLSSNDAYTYSNNYYDDYWKLGSKYKTKLNLNKEEVELLNYIYNPNNNFFNIEYCCLEILKLYLNVVSDLKLKYIAEETNLNEQFIAVSDVIARKQFRYRKGSDNYKYAIDSTRKEFFLYILKFCENTVREFYCHKRKLNLDIHYTSEEAKMEFEIKIVSKVNDLLPILISKVAKPDEATDIELNAQNTTRWKIKLEELTINYNAKPKEFIDSVISLGKLNKKNPSVENVFFEASKFIAKHDKESSLILYVYYLYYDLKSLTFDNKQHTKTIQKSLFKTNEQFDDFQLIVNNLIESKNLNKALKQVPDIYKIKRKTIQLDRTSIKEVIEQHSETVELLNEYLKDDVEEEVIGVEFEDVGKQEIEIKIPNSNKELHKSTFVDEIILTEIHIATLELFTKNNFSISQIDFETFAKSKGVFKNQLIESINETCYDFLDDLLIEEEEDYYTIDTNYFQKISTK